MGHCEFRVLETTDKRLDLSSPQVVSDRTNSPEVLDLAREWIRDCATNHLGCNDSVVVPWRPTRLLQIDKPCPGSVTLDCRSQDSAATRFESYVTLSHCWGDGNPLKLTSSTQRSLLEGISVAQLPLTFQEAIIFTRHLGLKFIWIDSLCIFQDSEEDWAREASLMGNVYSQAFCNIGATASSTGNEGCFRRRNPMLLDRTVIRSSWNDRPNEEFHVYPDERTKFKSVRPPLLLRGWVAQELILSRRFLHFDAKQLVFECRESYMSEMYPKRPPPGMLLLADPLKKRGMPNLILHDKADSTSAHNIHYFWTELVEYYSQCRLTVNTDRLAAISGIAKCLQAVLSEEYYAGMWESLLPRCLLWTVARGEVSKIAKPSSYVAPTWSWASAGVPVKLPNETRDTFNLAEVIQAKVVLASSDATGQISAGFIRLRSILWTALLEWKSPGKYVICLKSGSHEARGQGTSNIGIELDNPQVMGQSATGVKLHFILITGEVDNNSHWFEGLLLMPTGVTGHFERVGVFKRYEYTDLSRLVSAPNDDWLEYEEFDGDKYTITIV
ncbi:HET-domain-containing protein [Hyaloscypha variabilis F]|uniref:HET-domain-containing protein n=1 Tax=Hyaloscypha variabilis (strain UAMH 11265 / GT02V1 / F) TaxID=1149755 RepID=A0A2J6RLM3_HYAVF|nr:HET-domain-containing protein [Hyaloscypha variabilis F]